MKDNTKMRKFKMQYRRKWKYVIAVIPTLFLFVLLGIYPNIKIFPMSLYDWSPIRTEKEFVGLKNFEMMFTVNLDNTLRTIGNTLIYIAGLMVIQMILALILALAMQKNSTKNKFFRAYFFMPMVFSSTMISMTWSFMYDPNLGIINNILGNLGVEGYPGVNFFAVSWQAVILIVIVHIWAKIGYPITILTSGINSISTDVNEAAMIDGANGWQIFQKITFPLLLPTIFRLSLLTITTGAMTSEFIVMLGSRSAGKEFDTWSAMMYKAMLSSTDYGGVSAMGVVMFFFLAVASLIQFGVMRKVENSIF